MWSLCPQHWLTASGARRKDSLEPILHPHLARGYACWDPHPSIRAETPTFATCTCNSSFLAVLIHLRFAIHYLTRSDSKASSQLVQFEFIFWSIIKASMLFAMAHVFPETGSKQGTRFLSSTLTVSSVVSGMTLVIPGVSRINWKRRNNVKCYIFMFAALYQVVNVTAGLRKKMCISDKSSQKKSLNIYTYICIHRYICIYWIGWVAVSWKFTQHNEKNYLAV